jgi:GxxExxY protein
MEKLKRKGGVRVDLGDEKILYKDLSYRVIGSAMEVHKVLGFGFLEKVYENALMVIFRRDVIKAIQQAPLKVNFLDEVVGEYYADIMVEDKIILELKTVEKITNVHRAQALNYLRATGMKLAIILNFGKENLEHERLAY